MESSIKEIVRDRYGCNGVFACPHFLDCEFGEGCNTAFDCCECSADVFAEGIYEGMKINIIEDE